MLRLFISSFSMVIAGLGCAFITHMILAKVLSADEYGVFSFIFSLSLIVSVFSLFGFQNAGVKIIANFSGDNKDKNYTHGFVNFTRGFTLILSVCAAGATYGILYSFGFMDKYPFEAIILGVFLTPLMVCMRLHAAFLRGFHKSTSSVIYETTLREVLVLFLLLMSLGLGLKLQSGIQALWIFIGALFIVSICSWLHAARLLKTTASHNELQPEQLKGWIKLSFPMMLTIFAQRFLRRSDVIILGLMTSPALVGAYAIAAQFSEVGSIGQKGIFAIFSPRAATLFDQKKGEELKSLYRKMTLYGIFTAGAMCSVIGACAPYVLSFFGEGFEAGYTALLILLVGQFLNVCFGPVGVLMIMTEHERSAMKFTLMAAGGNLICNPIAIYFLGLEGAAATTTFFLLLRALLSYIEVKKHKLI